MTTTTLPTTSDETTGWLRLTRIGIAVAVVGLVAMDLAMLFGDLNDGGELHDVSGYAGTAAALPQGVGLLMTVLGVHRLQRGRDGRLGRAGVWVYGLCMTELVIQCTASAVVGRELIWGPLYPLCAFGLMGGLALLAAGSWRVGLLPRWMLAAWPPLGLIGSFLGIGPIPLVFALFLVVLGPRLPGRLAAQRV
jgi:hypothetical protein